jgi:NAD(P)H-dependent flavin oxidoreductase YrpB (nitropropane dioxygenase family)
MITSPEPVIVQGGMGAAVSSWPLARAVSQMGQLGVVSGTALDLVLSRRLQLGDIGGALRRAMAEFPFPEMIDRILDRYFISSGNCVRVLRGIGIASRH